jgi:uncharacterized protein YacL
MKKNQFAGFARVLIPIIIGVLVACLIVIAFQSLQGKVFPVLAEQDPISFYELTNRHELNRVKNEIIGLITGLFLGSFIAGFVSRKNSLECSLFVPVFVVILAISMPWHFSIQKELLPLVLPLWVAIALAAYYLSRRVKVKWWPGGI